MPSPSSVLYQSLAQRIATDPTKLGLSTFLKIFPIVGPYVPSLTIVLSDLTLGSGSLDGIAATAVTTTGLDPVSGQYKILVPPPSGGWTWSYDAVSPAPPTTVYGYALVDAATGLVLLGVSDLLNPELVLTVPSLVVLDEFSFIMLAPPLT
jgi:hypothetical protein